jgi:hypothetical protein
VRTPNAACERASDICERFESSNPGHKIQLNPDFDEGIISLQIGKQDILTEEDVFDMFFLPDLITAINTNLTADGEDRGAKSIIQLIQEAEGKTNESWRQRRNAKRTIWQEAYKLYTRDEPDEAELEKARNTFIKGRHKEVTKLVTKLNPSKMKFTDLDPDPLKPPDLTISRDARVQMIRIKGASGVILVIDKDEDDRMQDYRKTLLQEEQRHTEGDRIITARLFLHECKEGCAGGDTNVCQILQEYIISQDRSDKVEICVDTFKEAQPSCAIPQDAWEKLELALTKINDDETMIEFDNGVPIKDLIERARKIESLKELADEKLEVEIKVRCDKVDLHQPVQAVPVISAVPFVLDPYDKIYPEQRSVAQRLLDRVIYVMGRPDLGGDGGVKDGGLSAAFSDIQFLIFVPTFNTLKVQTQKRVDECLSPPDPVWEQHVMTYDKSYELKFKKFKDAVLENTKTLFVIIADESHWGYNRASAHDKFLNDEALLQSKNLVIVQVSATPYCNLTSASRVPERYILPPKDGTSEWKLCEDPNDKDKDGLEELHVVKWYPPEGSQSKPLSCHSTGLSIAPAQKSRYLRLEHFLRTIPSFLRHVEREKDVDLIEVVRRPLQSQAMRMDDFLARLIQGIKSKKTTKGRGKEAAVAEDDGMEDVDDKEKESNVASTHDIQPEHLWLADMILSLAYFRYYRWNSDKCRLDDLADSRSNVLQPGDSAPDDQIWRLFEDDNDTTEKLKTLKDNRLKTLKDKTRLLPEDSDEGIPSVKQFVKNYRGLCTSSDGVTDGLLQRAADKVISKITSNFASREYTGVEDGSASPDVKNEPDSMMEREREREREREGFAVFFFGKLAAEKTLHTDWKLEFISESDRVVLDLLDSSWEQRPYGWCVSGRMKIVRVMKGEYGAMVTDVLKSVSKRLFTPGPGAIRQAPSAPFAILRDFGQNEYMWQHLDREFRSLHLIREGNEDPAKPIRDWVLKDAEDPSKGVDARKLEYSHLEGLPCILILVNKGRMGDTFPHSFNCLDLRIRTSDNTTTLVQELGRLCRYPKERGKISFPGQGSKWGPGSKWEQVKAKLEKPKLEKDGQKVDPFDGGRKVLTVSFVSPESKNAEFLGYATHMEPWEERASATILFSGSDYTVEACDYDEAEEETRVTLTTHPPSSVAGSLEGCKIRYDGTTASARKRGESKVLHEILKYESRSGTFTLKGDRRDHFAIDEAGVSVIRDESCLRWLCDEAVRRSDPDEPQLVIGEVAHAFPYTLVTQPIMKKLEDAVKYADSNFPRQVWECIKLAQLDLYVTPAKKKQTIKTLISPERSLIHDYRRNYNGNVGAGTTNNNADGGEQRLLADTHARRFVLSAETQIGKTGAYCWFLKLLRDEIHGDEIPYIPSENGMALTDVLMADKLKWTLPYWRALCRKVSLPREPTYCGEWRLVIKPGKYHPKVKLQRLRLLLSVLQEIKRSQSADPWHDLLVKRLEGLSKEGECIQSQYHIRKADGLRQYLAGKQPPLEPLHEEDRFRIEDKKVEKVKEVLKRIIDWDCEDEKGSVYSAGEKWNEQLDLFETPGISNAPLGDGITEYSIVDQRKLVQQAFDTGCKTKKAEKGETWHSYLAKVPASPAGTDIVLNLGQESTKINREDVHWKDIFGSSNWPRISVPLSCKDVFIHDEYKVKAISHEGLARTWIFTPSYRRHLQGVASALLDRSSALEINSSQDQKFIQVLVVRGGEEFEHYRRDFGRDYVVLGMPDVMFLDRILEVTKSKQFKKQQVTGKAVEVCSYSGGVGYSRLFAQIFSRLLNIPTIWMIDDNVQCCYDIDVEEVFQQSKGNIRMPPPKPCSFAHVINSISAKFGDDTLVLDAHLTQDVLNAGPCPKSGDGRQTPRDVKCGMETREWGDEVRNQRNFSGQKREFALVGMSRDPTTFHRITTPFSVTHSVYSFFMLNVEHTVDRGIFFPPKSFWEDIYFNQLCEEANMVVLKCRLLFHVKKNLQVRNATQISVDCFPVKISIPGQLTITLKVCADRMECGQVWPQVCEKIKGDHGYQGCLIARARGIKREDDTCHLLKLRGEALDGDCEHTGTTFIEYHVDLLYFDAVSREGDSSQIDGMEHKQILRSWMAAQGITSVFSFPVDTDEREIDWKLLGSEDAGAAANEVKIDLLRNESIKRKIDWASLESVSLNVVCDALPDSTGAQLTLDNLMMRLKTNLRNLEDLQIKQIERVCLIFPEQLAASCNLMQIIELFRDSSGTRVRVPEKFYNLRTYSSAPFNNMATLDPTDTTFKLTILEQVGSSQEVEHPEEAHQVGHDRKDIRLGSPERFQERPKETPKEVQRTSNLNLSPVMPLSPDSGGKKKRSRNNDNSGAEVVMDGDEMPTPEARKKAASKRGTALDQWKDGESRVASGEVQRDHLKSGASSGKNSTPKAQLRDDDVRAAGGKTVAARDRSDQGWKRLLKDGSVRPGDRLRHRPSKSTKGERFGTIQHDGSIKEDQVDTIWQTPVAFACQQNKWHEDNASFKQNRGKMKALVRIRADEEDARLENLIKKESQESKPAGGMQRDGSKKDDVHDDDKEVSNGRGESGDEDSEGGAPHKKKAKT